MAKKTKQRVTLPTRTYRVLEPVTLHRGKLGPHDVVEQGGSRYVELNDKQAQYYVEAGLIELAS